MPVGYQNLVRWNRLSMNGASNMEYERDTTRGMNISHLIYQFIILIERLTWWSSHHNDDMIPNQQFKHTFDGFKRYQSNIISNHDIPAIKLKLCSAPSDIGEILFSKNNNWELIRIVLFIFGTNDIIYHRWCCKICRYIHKQFILYSFLH